MILFVGGGGPPPPWIKSPLRRFTPSWTSTRVTCDCLLPFVHPLLSQVFSLKVSLRLLHARHSMLTCFPRKVVHLLVSLSAHISSKAECQSACHCRCLALKQFGTCGTCRSLVGMCLTTMFFTLLCMQKAREDPNRWCRTRLCQCCLNMERGNIAEVSYLLGVKADPELSIVPLSLNIN